MKYILLTLLLSPFIAFSQAEEHPFDRMQHYLGVWYLEETQSSADAGVPSLKLVCTPSEGDNGAYCKIYGKFSEQGYQFMFSELLAYDKNTDSFHAMSYMDDDVTYASGPVDENGIWNYKVKNAGGEQISQGKLDIKPDYMVQEIRYKDGSALNLRWSRTERD